MNDAGSCALSDVIAKIQNISLKTLYFFKNMKIPLDYFQKGKGEVESDKLFAETLEAIVAAIYLDLKKNETKNVKLKKIIKKWFKKDLNSIKKSHQKN